MLTRLRGAARRLRALVCPRPLILCYHRVAEPSADPWAMAVSPANFASQIASLKASRRVLPVAEFVRSWVGGSLPPHAIAISFDDGYLDVLASARPALERHSVPATLFVSTGLLGEATFWWDELVALIALSQPERPVTLVHGDFAIEIAPEHALWDRRWRGWQAPIEPRQRCLVEARAALKPLDHASRSALLRRWRLELAEAAPACDGRPMTGVELSRMLEDPLFTVAAHTVSHVALTEVDRAVALGELQRSRQECEFLARGPVLGLAYPFGQHDAIVEALAAQAGFEWGLGLNEPAAAARSPFAIPRFYVPDVDGATLLERIAA